MSRSRKKKPGGGIGAARSDKPYKKTEHQRERTAIRVALVKDTIDLVDPRKFGNPYKSPKDGKQYWVDHNAAWMRK